MWQPVMLAALHRVSQEGCLHIGTQSLSHSTRSHCHVQTGLHEMMPLSGASVVVANCTGVGPEVDAFDGAPNGLVVEFASTGSDETATPRSLSKDATWISARCCLQTPSWDVLRSVQVSCGCHPRTRSTERNMNNATTWRLGLGNKQHPLNLLVGSCATSIAGGAKVRY